ncbi:MAG TPA: hypothetical protein VM056_02425 [Terriglobales bacterium]|nr:hypothetical protein [Terriglobales bacterium]
MRWAVGLVLLAMLAQAQEKPAAMSALKADRTAFTFTRYQLDVKIDDARMGFSARGTVTLRNDSKAPQPVIALQITSSLKWAAIRQGESSLKFVSTSIPHDADHTGAVSEAVATLAEPVQPGGVVELEIGYQGTIEQDATRLTRLGMPGELARRTDWDGISAEFTAIRGVGHVLWFPVALEPALLGDGNKLFRELGEWRQRNANAVFRVTYADHPGKMLIANGERKSAVENVYQMDRMGLEGPFFLIGDYSTVDTANGRVFYLKENEASARALGTVLAKLEPAASNGQKSAVQIVELPARWASHESGPTLLTAFGAAPEKELQQQLIHTLTHGSFYSARPWIYEGVAHLAQVTQREEQGNRRAALDYLEQRRPALALAEPDSALANDAQQSLVNSSDEIMYRTKAMFVWWMLRDILTPPVLKKALGEYRPELDKEPAYIQRLLETACGKQLEWFFSDWVYRDRGLPEFEVASVYPRQTLKGSYLVTVTIENKGGAGAEVPVRVRMKDGEVSARMVVRAREKATARIESAQMPIEVIVNDGSVPETDPSNNTFMVKTGTASPQ